MKVSSKVTLDEAEMKTAIRMYLNSLDRFNEIFNVTLYYGAHTAGYSAEIQVKLKEEQDAD